MPWIADDAAMVQCTTSGRTRMPPVLLGLPFPAVPTGLYARGLDPMALTDMGYERDKPTCVALLPPDPDEVRTAAAQLELMVSIAKATSEQITRTVPCACETADALGVRDLVVDCATIPSRNCAPSESRRDKVGALLVPLEDAVKGTPVPRLHWRLVGPTDRPTWFAERTDDLLGRHAGGSTVYRAGQSVPARDNFVLLRRLLEHEHVVAVIRQDTGKAFTVARVVDGMQILDHFALPPLANELAPLRSQIDNAQVDDIVAQLDKPARAYRPLRSPADGNFSELDAIGLDRVDAMLVAASVLAGPPYVEADEERQEPERYVERVAVQAPFGQEGRALRVAARLTDDGKLWATAMRDEALGSDLSVLDLSGEMPHFKPAATPSPPFVLRGTAANRTLVHGLHRMADAMKAVELTAPGAIEGKSKAWSFRIPQGMTLPAEVRPLAEQVLERSYRVTAEIDDEAGTIVADLVPE